MAEQYQSFQGKEPNIDVNLFVNALTQGVAAGNAQKNTLSAISQGVTGGINNAVSVASGVEQVKAQINANAVSGDEAVIEAKKQQQIGAGQVAAAQGQNAELEAQVQRDNEQIAIQEKTDALQVAAGLAAQKLGDMNNKRDIGKILTAPSSDPNAANSIFENPEYFGTLQRDPDFANQAIAQLEAKGADPAVIKRARSTFDAIALQKIRQKSLADEEQLTRRAQFETENQAALATHSLGGLKDFDTINKEGVNYQDWHIVPRSSVQIGPNGRIVMDPNTKAPASNTNVSVNDDKSSMLIHGDRVAAPYLSQSEATAQQRNLDIWKARKAALGAPTVNSNELPADAAKNAPPGDTGLGLAKGAATPGSTSNNNIVEAAKARNAQFQQGATAAGQAASYTGMIGQGNSIVNSNAPVQSYINTPQSVAVAPGVPKITQPIAPDYTPDPYAPGREEIDVPSAKATKTSQTTPEPVKTSQAVSTATATPTQTPEETTAIPVPPAPKFPDIPVPPAPKLPDFGSVEHAEDRLSAMVGTPVQLNTAISTPSVVSVNTVKKIAAIPALDNAPAYFKGMAAVESAGNPNAVGSDKRESDRGVGLFQFVAGTAADVGLKDRRNPGQSLEAAVKYNQQLYAQISKKLSNVLSSQGLSIKPDPRMVLAAFNGGSKWILNGLAAGHTTWPEMKNYLISVKNPAAARINTEYPDKVITASISFMKGGNASDDLWMKDMLNFGIVDVA